MWGLLQQDTQWIAALKDDLQWMSARLLLQDPLPNPADDLAPWHLLIETKPKYWKKLVNRAVRAEVLHRKHAHLVRSFHVSFCQRLHQVGALRELPAVVMEEDTPDTRFGCMQCAIGARTKAGESVHMFKVHSQTAYERCLMDGTQCSVCLREFHVHSRLQRHLKHSLQCRAQARPIRHRAAPLAGIGPRVDREQCRQYDGLVPTLQAEGPAQDDPRRDPFIDVDWTFHDVILQALFPEPHAPSTVEELITSIRRTIRGTPISWTRCRNTLIYIRDNPLLTPRTRSSPWTRRYVSCVLFWRLRIGHSFRPHRTGRAQRHGAPKRWNIIFSWRQPSRPPGGHKASLDLWDGIEWSYIYFRAAEDMAISNGTWKGSP